MRLLLVGPANSIHLARWANALAERHEVHLATLHAPGDQVYDPRVRLHRLAGPSTRNYFLAAPALGLLARRIKPELCHAHYATGYGTLARLGLVGVRTPRVLSVWGSDVYEAPTLGRLWLRLVRDNLRWADVVASTSWAMARQVERLARVRRLAVVGFGIDVDLFRPTDRPDSDVVTLGTVKALAPVYGIDTLLEAFALVRRATPTPVRLLLFGGGPDRAALEALADRLGIADAVTFRGQIPHQAVPAALAELDVYVALSRSESFGVAILEASACGLPVVVSDADGPAEVTVDGTTGLVVPRDDPAAAAAALLRLVTDPELRARMGLEGRAHVLAHYTWAESLATLESLYASLVTPRRSRTA
nr:glycosyltransferase family 4 protein [Propionibacterium sp.]